MQSQDTGSLSALRDIVEPDPVRFWPPAPGWYVVAGVVLVALALAGWRAWRRWRANAYRRAALAELDQLQAARAWSRLSELLKRTALAAFPRRQVASLSGVAWLEFLDRTGSTTAFTAGAARRLGALVCQPGAAESLSDAEASALVAACRSWLRDHRNGGTAC